MIKILFLAANPADTPQLSLDEESRAIAQTLRQTEFRDQFVVEQAWAVQVVDLQALLLQYKPDIVHFSGHGSAANEIILQDADDQSQPLAPRALRKLFALLKANIRCVILNACYSEEQARAIAQEIDCVIGMSAAIGDKAAMRFASTFYQALGYGKDVQTAFDLGCLQLDLENLADQDTPRLFAVKERADRLIFVTNPANPVPASPDQAPVTPVARHKRIPLALWVALIGLVGSLGAALITILPTLLDGQETPTPMIVSNPTSSPQPPAPTPTLTVPPTSAEPTLLLPEFAPLLTTTVAAATQPHCQNVQPAFARRIADALTAFQAPPLLLLEDIRPIDNGATAHQQGDLAGVDLVIWGECSQSQVTQLHFELTVERGAPEVFEPLSLNIPVTNDAQLERISDALAAYLRRDYQAASNSFKALADGSSVGEQQAWWRLLQGNSYLFRRQYNDAINAYQAAIQVQPQWAGAYHNLGMAHMNAAWTTYQFDPAFTAFTKTLQLDPDFALTYAVRGQLWLWLASVDGSPTALDQAATACRQASAGSKAASSVQALAQVCLAQVEIHRYRQGLEEAAAALHELALADLATPYWSAPLVTQGLSHYFRWRTTQSSFDHDQAESYLTAALQAGQDDVFLEGSRDIYIGLPALLRALLHK